MSASRWIVGHSASPRCFLTPTLGDLPLVSPPIRAPASPMSDVQLIPLAKADDLPQLLALVLAALSTPYPSAVRSTARSMPWGPTPISEEARAALAVATPDYATRQFSKFWESLDAACVKGRLDNPTQTTEFDHKMGERLDALASAPGVLESCREWLLPRFRSWTADAPVSPPLLVFYAKALASRRSARGDHVLGELAAESARQAPALMFALANIIPGDALAPRQRDKALASLWDEISQHSPSRPNALRSAVDRLRSKLDLMTQKGWVREEDMAQRLQTALWGGGDWGAVGSPEIAVELARALRAVAPGRPEWPEWIAAAKEKRNSALLSMHAELGERWAETGPFFDSLAADLERHALLAAIPPSPATSLPGEPSVASLAPHADGPLRL
jgi:hypothetical protein